MRGMKCQNRDGIGQLLPPLPGKLTPLHSGHFHHQGA
jgi:hypothetical protein